MKRVAIFVMLAALVGTAFGIRAMRGDKPAAPVSTAPQIIVCATEMAGACSMLADASLEVRVEAPGDTADRLRGGGALGGDAWLVPRPWVELVHDAIIAAGVVDPLGGTSETLARTPIVGIIRSDRRAVLDASCGARVDWLCLATRSGASWAALGGPSAWGAVRIGFDDPTRSTGGLVGLAQMAATFTRRTVFDIRDLDTIRTTLETVAATLPPPADRPALDTMLDRGDSFDLAMALEAGTRIAIAGPRASGQLEVVEIEPTSSADAVLVTAAGGVRPIDQERVRRALTSTGWHFPDKADSGVPDPATLQELLRLWHAPTGR